MIPQDPKIDSAASVESAFRKRFGRPPEVLVRAPGRVNLLGAHVDYQEGWVLPAAIDRGLWLAAAPGRGRTGRIHALDLGLSAPLKTRDLPPPIPKAPRPIAWHDYPAGVAWALREDAKPVEALDVVFGGNLPRESGVSSSAALEVAFLLAWNELQGLSIEEEVMAALGQKVENDYLGVGSGIMDQLASLLGRSDHFLFLDCRDLSKAWVPLPPGLAFLVADSGVRRRLVASGFNDRKAECRQAVAVLRKAGFTLRTLRDLPVHELPRVEEILTPILFRRTRHVVEECARVHQGVEALFHKDLETFGRLVRQSHESSRDLYEVSIPELDVLAEAAMASPGVHGARLSGGGFGGCVTALVDEGAIPEARRRIAEAFEARFGTEPNIFPCAAAAGAEAMAP